LWHRWLAVQSDEVLEKAGVAIASELAGAKPNVPRQDVSRLGIGIAEVDPDVIVVVGGGSTIDSAKAANVLATLGHSIDRCFGAGVVTQALAASGKRLVPTVAVQTASSSGAHLTKYSKFSSHAWG
jgi:alcohol dehydrogenase